MLMMPLTLLQLNLRYQVEDLPSKQKGCQVKVHFGIAWLKSTRNQKKITKNILQNLQGRLKVFVGVIEKEFATKKLNEIGGLI